MWRALESSRGEDEKRGVGEEMYGEETTIRVVERRRAVESCGDKERRRAVERMTGQKL